MSDYEFERGSALRSWSIYSDDHVVAYTNWPDGTEFKEVMLPNRMIRSFFECTAGYFGYVKKITDDAFTD